jgi:Cu/Ag efflux pump CusA
MPPSVEIQTEALGLSAAEVEQLITVPLEQPVLCSPIRRPLRGR